VNRIGAAALAAVILSGCGGSSGLDSPVALRRAATAICKSTAPVKAPPAGEPSSKELTAFLSEGTSNLQSQLTRLTQLHSATGEVGDVYRGALGALSSQLRALRAATAAIKRGEDPALAFKALQAQLSSLQQQADNAWVALQIPACVER
jgi:hypothetical protein